MKNVFGYVRVSTSRQGEGVSLVEQKKSIERYASQSGFSIVRWFEEKETAAKQGRGVFQEMLLALHAEEASGVIMHKIDRSARNLRDWADLVDLADQGIAVHFSNESIDMKMRGGRLSADIQAVVAADYIRNLREETNKGIRGRLEQGLYPWPAPVGYVNNGGGKVKTIDPVKGPLVAKLFELYGSGEYSIRDLVKHAAEIGLTNNASKPLSANSLTLMMKNPFYKGTIRVARSNESFLGVHEALIDSELYERVQQVMQGRIQHGDAIHSHTYRRLFLCNGCGRSLIGERQKGRVYYRCHLCPGVCIREDAIDKVIGDLMPSLDRFPALDESIDAAIASYDLNQRKCIEAERKAASVKRAQIDDRLSKLTDALLDDLIEKSDFLSKKQELVEEATKTRERLEAIDREDSSRLLQRRKALELIKYAYKNQPYTESYVKRRLLKESTSNCSVHGKKVVVEPHEPFATLANLFDLKIGPPSCDAPRTCTRKASSCPVRDVLVKYLEGEKQEGVG